MESFVVSPESTYLRLEVLHAFRSHYSQSHWGCRTIDGRVSEELTTGLAATAFDVRDGKKYIRGSDMYFSEEKTDLYGHGWVLQYKPIDGKS